MSLDKDFLVLIVGRENVGKSTFFNKLVGEHKSIVHDYPGVTRDKIYGNVFWLGKSFKLVDTGGILFDESNIIKNIVIKNIKEEIQNADLVIFLVDAKSGITPEDKEIYKFIKENITKFIVVVNKVDNEKLKANAYEFYNLGVDKLFFVSAEHSLHLDEVLDYIANLIPERKEEKIKISKLTKIAIVGKENVGKSSIFNSILNEERTLVTEIPGTTRDSIDSIVDINGKKFVFIDTAGIKKRKRIKEIIESYSIGRAFSNIKRSDIVLHVIDAMEGISEIDKKILGYAFEHYKGMIIVVNKWDLIDAKQKEKIREKYINYIRENLKFLFFAPIVFVSAKTKEGFSKLFDIVFYVENQYNFRLKTSILNKIFNEAIYERSPILEKSKGLKIYYITQVKTAPPEFVIFTNTKDIKKNYLRYLENKIREYFGFEGVPLKIKIKEKRKKEVKN